MTVEKIVPVDMDVYREPIDEMARYGGLKPGMVIGAGTNLPFYPPEPVLSWDEMSWRERVDSIKPGLAVTGALVLFIGGIGLAAAAIAGVIW